MAMAVTALSRPPLIEDLVMFQFNCLITDTAHRYWIYPDIPITHINPSISISCKYQPFKINAFKQKPFLIKEESKL